jgi:hypothetical protein
MFRLGVSVDDPLLWLGLALQIVGYVLAGVLLVRLREKVTGRASAVGLWWRRLLGMLRRLLRIGRDVHATAGATFGAGAVMRARGRVTSGEMPSSLSDPERIDWLYENFRNLEQRYGALFDEVGRESRERDKAIAEVRAAIEHEAQAARADFRNLIGADLNWELLAFAFIIAGTVLTTIAA